MVLDSPFLSVNKLCKEKVQKINRILGTLVKFGLYFIRKKIKKLNNFDISDINPGKYLAKCFVPIYFAVALDDDMVGPHHA